MHPLLHTIDITFAYDTVCIETARLKICSCAHSHATTQKIPLFLHSAMSVSTDAAGKSSILIYINDSNFTAYTYGHRLQNIGHPVRSAVLKLQTG